MQSRLLPFASSVRAGQVSAYRHSTTTIAASTYAVKATAEHDTASRGRPSVATMAATSAGNADTDQQAVATFRQLVPSLGGNYKGAHGKVAVVGGCLEFTGAPFFAAMSALRVGADMAYVICTPSAATAIKSYSPELMVLPYLVEQPPGQEDGPADQAAVDRAVGRILPWLARASAVVVGPGLGSDPAVCAAASSLIGETRRLGLPLVVDGSGLTHIVARNADTVAGYRTCLLTPNVAELGRIAGAVGLQLPGRMSDAWLVHAPRVAQAFRGPAVIAKGEVDLVCVAASSSTSEGPETGGAVADAGGRTTGDDGSDAARSTEQPQPQPRRGADGPAGPSEPQPLYRCTDPGALRRCGGQGDVLAGTAAAFLCWAAKHRPPSQPGGSPVELDSATVALCGYMACKVMRGAARRAFEAGERSMVAGDIIPLLYPTFKEVLGVR